MPTRTACKIFPKFFPAMRDETDPKSRFKFSPKLLYTGLKITYIPELADSARRGFSLPSKVLIVSGIECFWYLRTIQRNIRDVEFDAKMKVSASLLTAFYIRTVFADFAFPDFRSVERLAMQARRNFRVELHRFPVDDRTLTCLPPSYHSRAGSREPILGNVASYSTKARTVRFRLAQGQAVGRWWF